MVCGDEVTSEVRKAGVYYTPAHVVDYIVSKTVGELLKDRTPLDTGLNRDRKGAAWCVHMPGRPLPDGRGSDRMVRILDPACGAGAFLLGAYEHLLAWHRGWYVKDRPHEHTDLLRRGPDGQWYLAAREKRRILLNHIYGVDIDPQAVEVTKQALLLKLLEGEGTEAIGDTSRRFCEGMLRGLGENIKCGHALIGPDFYKEHPCMLRAAEKRRQIPAFDWRAEFPGVFGCGNSGFDAVIGNPPYLSFSGRQAAEVSDAERAYFERHYRTSGWATAHGMFSEAAVRHWARRFVAFIVPDQVGHLAGYAPVRGAVTQYSGLREVRYWGERVFPGVVTPALTFIADASYHGPTTVHLTDGGLFTRSYQGDQSWTRGKGGGLLAKLRRQATSLGELVADRGVHTGNCADKLVVPLAERRAGCVPVLEGRQVSRYRCDPPRKALRLDYRAKDGEYFRIRPQEKYAGARFVIRQTAPFPIVGPREHAEYFRNSLLALYSPRDGTDVRYVVGLLNSRLMRYVYSQTVLESRQRAFPQVKVRSLRELPVRAIDRADARDVALHDQLVCLVQQMLDLHKATAVGRQASVTDGRIDQLVYELYDLTPDEIRTVEEVTPCRPEPRR